MVLIIGIKLHIKASEEDELLSCCACVMCVCVIGRERERHAGLITVYSILLCSLGQKEP